MTGYFFVQEACCVGSGASLMPDDDIITAYRAHGWAFMKGVPIHKILAELFGMFFHKLDFVIES